MHGVTEAELSKAAANKGAQRVTLADVQGSIRNAYYHVFPDTMLTVCCLAMQNGFTVTGESACADPLNYDAEIGQRLAYGAAINKVWPLLGYMLRETLYQETRPGVVHVKEGGAAMIIGGDDHKAEFVARMAHEVNRAYCDSLGDHSQPAWSDAPHWQKESARVGVRFHWDNPEAGPDASHVSWLKQKEADGWKYGPVKDADKKEHPCYMPYDGLPVEQRAKDYLFRAVVHSLR